ncbi:MAG TPA: tetratricopeptide repeat protein [Streptosporangiaceae bacterium]|nr:tetratricopeptide repeat protein [Streptosporangiaceae bacterium]
MAGGHKDEEGAPDAIRPPFGALLRQLREAAGLTQEELAEAARLSPRAISDLERGVNKTARKETTRLLADALHLAGDSRAEFEAAARGRPTVAGLASATWMLPRDMRGFIGRGSELAQVIAVSASDSSGLCTIGGMAGVGKTALAVHAAHLLAASFPDGQLFLQLHGHTPGHDAVDPLDALGSLLEAVGVPPQQIPAGEEARARMWRGRLAGKKLLLVLDDALDSEQVRSLLPGAQGCLVLITGRRRLTGLDDAKTISLDALPESDAVPLLIGLADRPDLDTADAGAADVVRLCGYLPLAIGLLARRLHHHPAWTIADLAADLAAARSRLAYMHAEDRSVVAAFDLSYRDLTADQQRFFRRLGLHPGIDVDAYAAAALDGAGLDAARRMLEDLYDHYLLAEPVRGRYRMHDLIREYAHRAAENDRPVERVAATDRLLDYYLHAARLADKHLGRRVPPVTVVPPAHVPEFSHRAGAIAWLDAERGNLHATAQYAAAFDRTGHAIGIPAAMQEFLRGQGYWRQAVALDQLAVEAAHHADGQLAEARALTDLADMQYLGDDYVAARASLRQALDLYRILGQRAGEANALTLLGAVHRAAEQPAEAVIALGKALKIYEGLRDRLGEANALTELGTVQLGSEDLGAAESSLTRALTAYRELSEGYGEASALVQLGLVQHARGQDELASDSLGLALTRYRELGDRPGEARALNCIGEVALASADVDQARGYYEQALRIASDINAPREQARAFEGQGQCLVRIGQLDEGREQLHRALAIYQEIGSARAVVVRATLGGHPGP